jgi:hypothetical protein
MTTVHTTSTLTYMALVYAHIRHPYTLVYNVRICSYTLEAALLGCGLLASMVAYLCRVPSTNAHFHLSHKLYKGANHAVPPFLCLTRLIRNYFLYT